MTSDSLIFVPAPIYRIIPFYNGDKSKLNFFLRKCEYVIDMYKGNEAQNVYLFHTISSRLVNKAAALLSAREDIKTWLQLKDLLIQNYGDPRSEESIAVVLKSLKKQPHESLLKYYNNLQAFKKYLISKIDTKDELVKSKREAFYSEMVLDIFMNKLPEYLVRILRLKSPNSLEEAYTMVQEEISFYSQYSQRHYTDLNTLPELQCFYPFGVFFPFYQQPTFRPEFDSLSNQVQSANHNKESGPALYSSAESSTQATSGQNSPRSSKMSDTNKIIKRDVHDDVVA